MSKFYREIYGVGGFFSSPTWRLPCVKGAGQITIRSATGVKKKDNTQPKVYNEVTTQT